MNFRRKRSLFVAYVTQHKGNEVTGNAILSGVMGTIKTMADVRDVAKKVQTFLAEDGSPPDNLPIITNWKFL